jgi:cysteine synthase
LREIYPRIKIVAVEPKGSVTFGGRPGKRYIPGVGTSVRPSIADFADPDRIVAIDELTTVKMCLSFAQDYSLLVGGSTGTVLAAIKATSAEFARGETVIAISPDMGDKYLDTIYNPEWAEKYVSASAAVMSES